MLDYFDQTVNHASRVRGLAEGGEIWLTEQIYNAGVAEILDANGYRVEKQSVVIKGISNTITVYRYRS